MLTHRVAHMGAGRLFGLPTRPFKIGRRGNASSLSECIRPQTRSFFLDIPQGDDSPRERFPRGTLPQGDDSPGR